MQKRFAIVAGMRRKIDLIVLLLVLVSGFLALKNARAIGDWWHAQRYDPPAEIAKLADDAGMNERGKKLFFRFSPQLLSEERLTEVCSGEKLGCVEGRFLYLLGFQTDEEYNRTIVSAAHEMLHVAYSRLSEEEIQRLEELLDAELQKPSTVEVVKQLAAYPEADYFNEAHSFIGSEIPAVQAELEEHYRQYFADRRKTTRAFLQSPEAD